MKKTGVVIALVLVVLLLITGVVVYKTISKPKVVDKVTKQDDSQPTDVVPTIDPSVSVDLVKSKAKANTVDLTISGMGSKYVSVGYELSYDSLGLIKGVNSGSKPIDVINKDSFDREVYLGTCSKNDCKPDAGVKKVSIVLEFTDSAGKKSQFSKDYDL
jgi:hypothetical protein